MNKDAVEDAKRNAQLNSRIDKYLYDNILNVYSLDINNIEFIAEKIEDTIHNLVNKYEQQRLVAILDPPRAGVRM